MTNPNNFEWTPERIERLGQMWNIGKSASECAAVFGVSRNACIGKIHREGLKRSAAALLLSSQKPPKPRNVRRPQGFMSVMEAARVAGVDRKTMMRWAQRCEFCRHTDNGILVTMASIDAYFLWRAEGQYNSRNPKAGEPMTLPGEKSQPRKPFRILAEVRGVILADLNACDCRFPVNTPDRGAADRTLFCAMPAMPFRPYCEAHMTIAFKATPSQQVAA